MPGPCKERPKVSIESTTLTMVSAAMLYAYENWEAYLSWMDASDTPERERAEYLRLHKVIMESFMRQTVADDNMRQAVAFVKASGRYLD